LKFKSNNTIQAFWLGLGSLSSLSLAIVSAAILSRCFTKTEYGTYRQILYVYNTLLVIFSAGLPSVFAYFLPRYSLQIGKDIVRKISKALVVLGAVFSVALIIFSGFIANTLKNPELERGLRIFSLIPILLLPTLGLEGIFSTYKCTGYIAIYNTITRILMLLCIVLPAVLLKSSYEYAIYGWIVASFFSLFLAFYFKSIPFLGVRSEKTLLNYKDIFKYSLPIATASFWIITIRSADQFFISRYFGTEVFAEFSNGFIDLPFVSIVTTASANVVLPIFSKLIVDKSDVHEVMSLWRSTLIKSAYILYPVVVFFIFNARDLIILVYSNLYEKSTIYFQIAMMVNFFNIILFSPLMFSIGETKVFSMIHFVFAIATWVLEYLIVLLFHSPILIAICSVSMSILRVFVFINFLSGYFKTKLIELLPVKDISALFLHSVLSMTLTKLTISFVLPYVDPVIAVTMSLSLFLTILIFTSKFFRLDYLTIISPILNSTLNKYFKRTKNQ
jgi:O-antigen/teichoic acid export membrane protein